MKINNKVVWLIGSLALTAIGFIVIPPLIDEVSTKLYKKSLSNTEIDVDSLEPEIVKKTEEQEDA